MYKCDNNSYQTHLDSLQSQNMSGFRPKVISLNKKPGQTFGFYLRSEYGEAGHVIRCLEMGGPAELAGIKDGDRILHVNGKFVDELPHLEVRYNSSTIPVITDGISVQPVG